MPKLKSTPPIADKVLEKHGAAEVSTEAAARQLGVSPSAVQSLVESGEIKSTRLDPLGSPIIDYGSVIDYIVTLRNRGHESKEEGQEPSPEERKNDGLD
jgi:hypothetical protein